jgi:hypothetical protein
MELKRVGVLSAGKVMGIYNAVLGVVFALFMFPFYAFMAMLLKDSEYGIFTVPLMFNMVMLVITPVFWGVFGFIMGAIGAALYNLSAKVVGGLELEFEERAA